MVRVQPDPPVNLSRDRFLGQARRSATTCTYVHEERCNDASPKKRGISSAGRAPALQAGGRRFDPVILHHPPNANTSRFIAEAMSRFLFAL